MYMTNYGRFAFPHMQIRPTPQAPLGPGAQSTHLRRESSQSTHSDMSNHMGSAPAGPGRGGYSHQGGRGRGYSQSGYQGQMPYSPGHNFRTPNQPRAGPNMGPQFHGPGQGRPLAPFPNSPHQASRSPALATAHPATTPQMNPVPMAPPQMPPQPFGAYGQHMGPQAVRLHHPLPPIPLQPPRHGPYFRKRTQGPRVFSSPHPHGSAPTAPPLPIPNLAPESGQFEEYLTLMKNPQAYPHAYDPNYAYYNPAAYGMQQMQYMAPPSPQPRPGIPFNPQAPYMQNQYPAQPPAQAAPLSRTPSQVSNTDRPNSSMGQPQPPAGPPGPSHAHTASRSSNSPAPKSQFVIPSTKKSPLIIKDPSGAVKNFEKGSGSPAQGTPSPVKVAASPAATPPPRSNNGSVASDHQRSDSKAAKSDEEKKRELRDAVLQRKIEQDEAEQRQKSEEEEASRKKDGEATQKKAEEEEAATKKAAADEESTRKAMENVSLNEKTEEAKPTVQAEEPKKAPAPAPAPADDDDIDFDAIEREMAETDAKEAAAEKDYYAKKQRDKEEKERKEKEDNDAYEANMKNAEREAEALEEAREKKREAGESEKGGLPGTETSTPIESGATTPASDISMGPPGKPASAAKREKPTSLKLETSKAVEPPQPSAAMKALHTARFLVDLSKISYPSSVVSPNPALNANAPSDRKFHYNKEFLLQFQNVFKEKPSVDWDARVRETVGDPEASSRPQSARTPMTAGGGGGRTSSRPGMPHAPFQGMGTFGQPNRHSLPPGSTDRFAMQNAATIRSASNNNPFGSFGRPGMGMPGMSRTNSAASMQAGMPGPNRVPSSRQGTRNGSKRDKHQAKREEDQAKNMPLTAGQEVPALHVSQTGWKPRSLVQSASGPALGASAHMPPDMVQRKVKGALNKMTPENFERISVQILEIVSQSKAESDGRTLRQVIQLTFEKATDEAHWASIYAKFCKRMLESMSPDIKDESIRDKAGNVVAGGSLFRKYLLNRCQEEFERGWKANLPPKPEGDTEEAAMMSDEYYVAAAAKRRGLGLVKFIGELYKLGMLTERIMHECVKRLVDYEGMPDEAEVESLTNLLRTIGASLDVSEKGHTLMDVYFARIKMMMETEGLNSRLHFMLLVSCHPDIRRERKRLGTNIFIGRYRFEELRLGIQGCREGSQNHSRNSGAGMLQNVLSEQRSMMSNLTIRLFAINKLPRWNACASRPTAVVVAVPSLAVEMLATFLAAMASRLLRQTLPRARLEAMISAVCAQHAALTNPCPSARPACLVREATVVVATWALVVIWFVVARTARLAAVLAHPRLERRRRRIVLPRSMHLGKLPVLSNNLRFNSLT